VSSSTARSASRLGVRGVDADYEIGSISTGITGLLYVQALDRGEITAESFLGIDRAGDSGVGVLTATARSVTPAALRLLTDEDPLG
jgi:hypothetical protein